MNTLTVDIWSDITCPWCAIGYAQFAKAVATLAGEVAVDVRFMPFELNPDFPVEGREQDAHFAAVMGKTADELAGMRAHVEAAGEAAGFSMRYAAVEAGDEPARMVWNTFAAHKLLRWALAAYGSEAQQKLKLAFLQAHFQQRKAMADEEVLLGIVAEAGLDRTAAAQALHDEALSMATAMEAQRGRSLGINSVPSFVLGGKYLVQGARAPEDFVQIMRQAVAALSVES